MKKSKVWWEKVDHSDDTESITSYTGIFIPTVPDSEVRPGVIIPDAAHVIHHPTTRTIHPTVACRFTPHTAYGLPYSRRMLLQRREMGLDVPEWFK